MREESMEITRSRPVGISIIALLLSMVIPAVILIYFLADEHVRSAFAV